METPSERDKHEKERQESIKPYAKYSGLAFQMIGALVLAAFGGKKLDDYFATGKPWFTIALLLLAVVVSMVTIILSINKK
ncbi:AtpZ/AtpI family protein [Pontibacter silvestris]|uniref:AtpZ/AtpI family protein n=1 Tax=Pontibacter silvestris TaxID=2305183 RepID=A0ABW4X3H8_9BACT|nr:AtpZ/AtpI family protein [Pontibacter silvestris]MCC9135856.1 AtpZ/AtpI family protein [Pontibacter silvestris]